MLIGTAFAIDGGPFIFPYVVCKPLCLSYLHIPSGIKTAAFHVSM